MVDTKNQLDASTGGKTALDVRTDEFEPRQRGESRDYDDLGGSTKGLMHSLDMACMVIGNKVRSSHVHLHVRGDGVATPGLIIDIPDVYAEGMLFAGTKLYEEGRRNEALWEYIRRNSRAARQLQDDLDAQIASARLRVRRFNELLERYGMDTVLTARCRGRGGSAAASGW